MNSLKELQKSWQDTPEYHKHIHESFIGLVNAAPELKAHRDYVETNTWGFGERSFWWLWKLICDEVKDDNKGYPYMLEVGVFRAATLSLWRMLMPNAMVFGITPLSTAGGVWESDYATDIKKIHKDFNLHHPEILKGFSNDAAIVSEAEKASPYSVTYIDGDHSFAGALFDLNTYAPMVAKGGYLVIDDAACRTSQPWGYFQGIDTVSEALAEWEKSETAKDFEFQFNVVHLMIYKRKR